ncbi:MAG TPA: hypothetical protein VK619_01485 [Pyrinomonadaceae bacterium]|nr:hypothetical protein [Pyrinomonadaceae bacterium]
MKKYSGNNRFVWRGTLLALTLFAPCTSAMAQCAMCRAAVAGSANAETLSRALNLGGLILLLPPIILFTGFFVLIWHYARAQEIALSGIEKENILKRWLRSNWLSVFRRGTSVVKREAGQSS